MNYKMKLQKIYLLIVSLEKSLINKANPYNSDRSMFDLDQDSIIIFPSKTPHATVPNKSGDVFQFLEIFQ